MDEAEFKYRTTDIRLRMPLGRHGLRWLLLGPATAEDAVDEAPAKAVASIQTPRK